jgi:FixJ family two-component response regulator
LASVRSPVGPVERDRGRDREDKQAAAELGISEVTLQIHRGRIMHKMEAQSLAELVRMAGTLMIPVTNSRR